MGAPTESKAARTTAPTEAHVGKGRTRVAGVGLADDIGRQGTDGGNGDVVCLLGGELGHGWGGGGGGEARRGTEVQLYTRWARAGVTDI